jgi:serine/threonine-protein kinase
MTFPDEPTSDLLGTHIGPFELIESLGTLGLAERYVGRAADGTLRMVGIVVAQHPDLVRTLADLGIQQVRHPGVLQLYEVLEIGKQPVLITDLVRGLSLREWLEATGRPGTDAAVMLIRGIAEAVGAMHGAGFAHRDLRPETVLVSGPQQAPEVHVMDLGVASAVFMLVTGGRSVTTSGSFVGKPHYWAPERARRPQEADERSDLFSLGCMLYELFAGRGPFAGLNLYDCYHATLEGRYTPLRELNSKVPDQVLATVERLLAPAPADRLQSIPELLERIDIFTLVGDDPQLAQAPPPPTPSGSHRVQAPPLPARSPPVLPIIGVVAAAAVALGVGWWLLG